MASRQIGILGSGFGLYGYVPAALSQPDSIVLLPSAYRGKFQSRKELAAFADRITWMDSADAVVRKADILIIARRPADQYRILRTADFAGREFLVLEKPLAPTPEQGAHAIQALELQQVPFKVGYTFAYTSWGKQLRDCLLSEAAPQTIHISWDFLAHHYRHNVATWKRNHAEGGGVLRFYGIQVLSVLAAAGQFSVVDSEIEVDDHQSPYAWRSWLRSSAGHIAHVTVDCMSEHERFAVTSSGSAAANLSVMQQGPFDSTTPGHSGDLRVDALVEVLDARPSAADYQWYRRTNSLWAEIERSTSGLSRERTI